MYHETFLEILASIYIFTIQRVFQIKGIQQNPTPSSLTSLQRYPYASLSHSSDILLLIHFPQLRHELRPHTHIHQDQYRDHFRRRRHGRFHGHAIPKTGGIEESREDRIERSTSDEGKGNDDTPDQLLEYTC
jgi:hypothetical protein